MVGINKEKEMNATQNIGYIEPKTEKLVVTIAMTLKRCLIQMWSTCFCPFYFSFFAKKNAFKALVRCEQDKDHPRISGNLSTTIKTKLEPYAQTLWNLENFNPSTYPSQKTNNVISYTRTPPPTPIA